MNIIEYSDEDFAIVKEKDYGEPAGKYRMIRYDTGYYALQRYTLVPNTEDVDAWETMCICPVMDDPLTPGRVWNLCEGKLTIESLLLALEDSCKLQNNELMELHLTLNPGINEEVSEKIVKIIKTSEGDEIYDNIMESIRLQDEWVHEYYAKKSKSNNGIRLLLILLCIIGLCVLFL